MVEKCYICNIKPQCARGRGLSRYSDTLQAERSGHRIPPVPVPERSKARICGLSLAGVSGSNPAGDVDDVVCAASTDKRQNAGLSRKSNKDG